VYGGYLLQVIRVLSNTSDDMHVEDGVRPIRQDEWDAMSEQQKELWRHVSSLRPLRCRHCGSIALQNKGRRKRKNSIDVVSYKCDECGRNTFFPTGSRA
jgi:RNase P subunit RPR2